MKTVIVIQARLGSSRLPCKTLLSLHGLPVIDWVVRRCARARLADALVVALPDTRQDDVLANHLHAQGIAVFRGSEQDVLARMYGAAAAHKAEAVVRVCADNPLIWGEEIDNLI
ncbi:MAG: NTP transferase domain-containing protein, partial [Bilophila sp.]